MHYFSLLVAAATTVALAACSTPYKPPEFVGKQTEFLGVADLLSGSPAGKLDVVLTHGMCTHHKDWAELAVKNLLDSLDMEAIKVKLEPAIGPFAPVELYQQTVSTPYGELRLNALVWSPLTTTLKQSVCYDQTEKSEICLPSPSYPYKRARLNRMVKDELINDCLADALVYQGKSRDYIVGKVQLALLQAAANSGGQQSTASGSVTARAAKNLENMLLISESLGSKIVLDSIDALARSEAPFVDSSERPQAREAGISLASRTVQVFMGANQIPILGLADADAGAGPPSATAGDRFPLRNPLLALVRHSPQRSAGQRLPPRIVAFSDPNDLLSYPLISSPYDDERLDITDVIVSNAHTFFGYLENPTKAHVGYRSNEDVQSLIACGKPKSKRCK